MSTAQSASTATKVEIAWPEPPNMFQRFKEEDNRAAFDKWFYELKKVITNQLEEMAKVIDSKANKPTN